MQTSDRCFDSSTSLWDSCGFPCVNAGISNLLHIQPSLLQWWNHSQWELCHRAQECGIRILNARPSIVLCSIVYVLFSYHILPCFCSTFCSGVCILISLICFWVIYHLFHFFYTCSHIPFTPGLCNHICHIRLRCTLWSLSSPGPF